MKTTLSKLIVLITLFLTCSTALAKYAELKPKALTEVFGQSEQDLILRYSEKDGPCLFSQSNNSAELESFSQQSGLPVCSDNIVEASLDDVQSSQQAFMDVDHNKVAGLSHGAVFLGSCAGGIAGAGLYQAVSAVFEYGLGKKEDRIIKNMFVDTSLSYVFGTLLMEKLPKLANILSAGHYAVIVAGISSCAGGTNYLVLKLKN